MLRRLFNAVRIVAGAAFLAVLFIFEELPALFGLWLAPKLRLLDPDGLAIIWLLPLALIATAFVLLPHFLVTVLVIAAIAIAAAGYVTALWFRLQRGRIRVELNNRTVDIIADRVCTGEAARALCRLLNRSSPGESPASDLQFFIDGVRQPPNTEFTLDPAQVISATFLSPWGGRRRYGSDALIGGFDFRTRPVPNRTNKSVSLYLRETLSTLGHSLPLLVAQGLVVLALVFVDQGRAFLVIGNSIVLASLITASAVTTVFFARVLARRAEVDPTDHPDATDRIRWLALQTASGVAGIIAGFLPAAVIERFAATNACAIPADVLKEYGLAAVYISRGVTLALATYLAWRVVVRSYEGTKTRDVLLALALFLLPPAAIRFSRDYYLLLLGLLLVVSSLLLTIPILTGPAPDRARGGMMDRRDWMLATVSLLAGLLVAIFPDKLPSGAVLFIILQFWIAAALLVNVGLRWSFRHSLPSFLLALTFLAVGVCSFWDHAFHARPFRTADRTPAPRPLLSNYVHDWIQQRVGASGRYPIILVSASGGGIRAAYWTAALLSGLQDREPKFANHVLGISAVSGGSVGAAVFRSLIADACHHCMAHAERALDRDFLAPALSSLLTRDVLTGMIPALPVPDRGIALERAFENAWQGATGTQTLGAVFNGHAPPKGSADLPVLFLNSTEAGSARRAVFSDVSLIGTSAIDQGIQRAVESQPVTLSTAMILSARFPYISPEASLSRTSFRFVDGGYYDNSGAATLIDVVNAVRHAVTDLNVSKQFRIVVLQVQNEPTQISKCEQRTKTGGFSTPLEILDELRSQRAVDFAKQLERELPVEDTHEVIRNLTPQGGKAEFPLGWTLPESTRKEMHNQITNLVAAQETQLGQLLQSLNKEVTTITSRSPAPQRPH